MPLSGLERQSIRRAAECAHAGKQVRWVQILGRTDSLRWECEGRSEQVFYVMTYRKRFFELVNEVSAEYMRAIADLAKSTSIHNPQITGDLKRRTNGNEVHESEARAGQV